MDETLFVSILIPTSNRAAALTCLLSSFAHIDYPKDRLEIIIVDDGSTDATKDVASRAAKLLQPIPVRYIFIPKSDITHAKNAGLAQAAGEIVAFTDDDCTVEPGWLTKLVRPFEDASVAVVGGPDRAPSDSSPFEEAVDYAMTGLVGTGGVRRGDADEKRLARYLPRGCNMAFRRSLAAELGGFDTSFYNGEEIDLDYRMIQAGHRTAYAPDAWVCHHRRATPHTFARQMFHRGLTRMMLFRKHPAFTEWSYFAPAAMVICAILLIAAALVSHTAGVILKFAVAAYAALLAGTVIHAAWKTRHIESALTVPLVIALQHTCYGLGVLAAPFTSRWRSVRSYRTGPLRILISNDGFGPNQGDRAILEVMTSDLRATFPGVEIRGFLNSWMPTPRALLRFWRDMRWADVFLLGGGQVLHDHTCLLFLLAALGKLAIARFAATPAVCYAIGAGPMASRLGRRLTRHALNRVELILARDEASAALLREIGVRADLIHVTACPAFRLAAQPSERVETLVRDARRGGGPLVVICPRRWFQYEHGLLPLRWKMWYRREPPGSAQFSRLLDTLAELIRRLVHEQKAYVLLLPMKQSAGGRDPGQDDDAVCSELAQRAANPDAVHVVSGDIAAGEVKSLLGRADAVVTMRMHAAIMALPQHVPCVALTLSSKFMDLYRRLRIEDLAVSIESATPDLLFAAVSRALEYAPRMGTLLHEPLADTITRSTENAYLLQQWVKGHLRPESAGETG